MDEEYKSGSGGSGECMACPHCGKPIMLAAGPEEKEPGQEGESASWEDDLRHTMSPRTSGNEEAM